MSQSTKDDLCEACNGTGLQGPELCSECKGTPSEKERNRLSEEDDGSEQAQGADKATASVAKAGNSTPQVISPQVSGDDSTPDVEPAGLSNEPGFDPGSSVEDKDKDPKSKKGK